MVCFFLADVSSATHQTSQAKTTPYQPLLIKPVFCILQSNKSDIDWFPAHFCKNNTSFFSHFFFFFGGGGLPGSIFAGYVPLASKNPNPIIVYSVVNYRTHLSHFWPRFFHFLDPTLPDFSHPRNPENVRPHSSNSTKI